MTDKLRPIEIEELHMLFRLLQKGGSGDPCEKLLLLVQERCAQKLAEHTTDDCAAEYVRSLRFGGLLDKEKSND